MIRPRLGELPLSTLSPEAFPGWYDAAAQVAEALGARAPRVIAFTAEFNASFTTVGWRGTPVLRLGVPLLTILDDQEIVALLAHEMAHEVNGDAARGVVVGSALHTLMRWYDACTPGRVDLYSGNGSLTFSAMAAYFIGAVLAALIRVHILVLRRLLYANAQRAEYFADYLAAQVAGTPAVLSLMDKSHLQGLYRNAVQVATRKEDRDLFAILKHLVQAMPEREWDRIHRIALLDTEDADSTHPSTAHRIAVLEAHPVEEPMAVFDRELLDELQRELATTQRQMQQEIIAAYFAQR